MFSGCQLTTKKIAYRISACILKKKSPPLLPMRKARVGELPRAALTHGDRCIVPIMILNAGAVSFADQVYGALQKVRKIMQSKSGGSWITVSTKRRIKMNDYEFTLKFAINDTDAESVVNRLYESGCDDAIIGTGQHARVALNFIRSAQSAEDAISSAIRNVKDALPDAVLIEATPDFVGVTDIAEILGCTRQNVRKIVVTHRAAFPRPVHDGDTVIWHLASVLPWFMRQGKFKVEDRVLEVASINMQINVAKEMQAAGGFEKFTSLLA